MLDIRENSTWSFGWPTVFSRHGLPTFQQVHFLHRSVEIAVSSGHWLHRRIADILAR